MFWNIVWGLELTATGVKRGFRKRKSTFQQVKMTFKVGVCLHELVREDDDWEKCDDETLIGIPQGLSDWEMV